MKGLKYFLFLIGFFLLFSFSVKANKINKIAMDIYLDNSGNAHITEVWDTYLNQGTEGYHPYYNLGNSTISDLKVSDERGTNYTTVSYWDINSSFERKRHKSGIYKSGNEVDICWGISDYGNKIYTVKYTINNAIYNTSDDTQIFFWQLIPKNMKPMPEKVYIKIYSDKKFEDTLDVWGYGNYGGTAYVYNGYIEMQSPEKRLNSSDYMTILVKFPANYFSTTNTISKTWNQVFAGAEEGTVKYKAKTIDSNEESNKTDNSDKSSDNASNEVKNSDSNIVDSILNGLVEDTSKASAIDNKTSADNNKTSSNNNVSNNSNSKSTNYIPIIIAVVSILIIGLVLFFVYKKKSNNNTNLY